MLTYDIECPVTFADDVPPDAQILFRRTMGGRPGWVAALPVVRWSSPRDALVLFVLREPEGSAEDAICQKAVAQVREWLAKAGLAPETGLAPDVGCTAIPRG
jgi:hypothetical protein